MFGKLIALIKRKSSARQLTQLRLALEALPEEYRAPLMLQVVHGLSLAQIGQCLGLSRREVGKRLQSSRLILMKSSSL